MLRPLLWAAIAVMASPCGAETRRALVVGIDKYITPATAPAAASSAPLGGRLPLRGTVTRTNWTDLDGAVNDARRMTALLTGRFGFAESNIVTLTDERATAAAILGSLQAHLIDSAAPGDVSLFYFAGHGSQIPNRLSGEADGLDETLVPADARQGVADIRDKELARLYRAAAAKGVLLTVIQDSCHSGSSARGAWNARGKRRLLPPDGRYVEDPPDRGAGGNLLKTPEQEGVLVMSASQDDEPAEEVATDTGSHGLFSFALFHALETSPADEQAGRLFQRIRAVMQSEGALQEPVLAGAGRDSRSLLGLPARSESAAMAVTAAVSSVAEGRIVLQAGAAAGLSEGTELGRPGEGAVRLAITRVTGLHSSEAKVLQGDPAAVHEGDLFRVDRWVTPDFDRLRVFIPQAGAALPHTALEGVAKRVREGAALAGVKWVDDPTLSAPGAVMSWQGNKGWILEPNPAETRRAVKLAGSPTARDVAAVLRSLKTPSLFLALPAPAELALADRLPGTVALEREAAKAHYVLFGRLSAAAGRGLEWAWMLPGLTEAGVQKNAPLLALPLRSEWFPSDGAGAASQLADSAAAIARVRRWLQLPSPPADPQFPYRLVLKNVGSGQALRAGEIVEGERFKMWLEAPEPPAATDAAAIPQRWVYVFAIDREGRGTLLFPAKGQGNVSNRLPVRPSVVGAPLPRGFPLTAEAYDLEVAAPFGVDTYFLLVSAEALPNPEVLDFAGVYQGTRGGGGGKADSGLAGLIGAAGSGTRGQASAIPLNWFLERQTFRSLAKKK